jgi:SET domain-containing protein
VFKKKKCQKQIKTNEDDSRSNYAAKLVGAFDVFAEIFGNESRFINHSCTPNAEMRRWVVSLPHFLLY